MSFYFTLKRLFTGAFINAHAVFRTFNLAMNARRVIKLALERIAAKDLSPQQKKIAKAYYKAHGYRLNNTYWHRYYYAMTGEFYVDYIPEDIFRSRIAPRLNEQKQWPALLDKNLIYNLFKEFAQPVSVVQNINGFFYVDGKLTHEDAAAEKCNQSNKKLIIKPSIESGQGRLIEVFSVENDKTSLNGQSTKALFNKYKKDYIIQEFLEQSEALKRLNDSTLNTMRIMSYLRSDGVHVLSTVLRIGKSGAHTDNYTLGGIICGVQENGKLKPYGFTNDGKRHAETLSGVSFDGFQIPNYKTVINFVKKMHPIVPYFKIISWDIALDASESPVLIEYNTYYQATELHQVTNGPLFGEFKDEILAAGLD